MADQSPHDVVPQTEQGEAQDWQQRVSSLPSRRERRAYLQQRCRDILGDNRLLVASNRGPLGYAVAPGGGLQARRGRGGPVSTLKAAYESCRATWVSCAMSESDREAMATARNRPIQSPMPDQDLRVRFVSPSKDQYHKYYNIVSNPLLWFLQHSMWNFPWTPNITEAVHDAWSRGYQSVNQSVAAALAEEALESAEPPLVLVQDYQLYLVPGYLREKVPGAMITHFTHIPWPDVSHWRILPVTIREPILRGLLASDVVAFQSVQCVRNFLHTCRCLLRDAHVDEATASVELEGWTAWVRCYPVTIDLPGLRRALDSQPGRGFVESLRPKCGEHTIVRVDRAEPSRNIIRGFKSYERLLQRFPEMIGRVRFLAFLASSRSRVWEYQRHMEDINRLVGLINSKHGKDGWQPIEVFRDTTHLENLAALSLYDVLLVNPVTDGMSLVAKEGPAANGKDGVLVLSDTTGAHEQLKQGALGVCPTDLEGTAEALYLALTLPQEERRRMISALREVIEAEDPLLWLCSQMSDLKQKAPAKVASGEQGTVPPQALPED